MPFCIITGAGGSCGAAGAAEAAVAAEAAGAAVTVEAAEFRLVSKASTCPSLYTSRMSTSINGVPAGGGAGKFGGEGNFERGTCSSHVYRSGTLRT